MSRSYAEYSKELIVGILEQVVESLRPEVVAGAGYFTVYLPHVAYDPVPVERFAKEVIPHVG